MHKKHGHPPQSLDQLLDEIRSRSELKITEPRKAILQALLQDHGPFSAEEIHQNIPKKICDLATIYRSLNSLEEAGFVRRCEFGDGTARYELSDRSSNHHHHHVICTQCKRIDVLDDCELQELDHFAKKRGYTDITHSLEFFGVCPQCRKN
jgi:Fur family transcriptional regulator, ferric uptake regulator